MKKVHSLRLVSSCLASVMWAPAALAQTAPAADDAAEEDDQILVIGTLIRGTTVTGSQTITVSRDQIDSKPAFSTNELLQTIPQIANQFNGRIEGDPRQV